MLQDHTKQLIRELQISNGSADRQCQESETLMKVKIKHLKKSNCKISPHFNHWFHPDQPLKGRLNKMAGVTRRNLYTSVYKFSKYFCHFHFLTYHNKYSCFSEIQELTERFDLEFCCKWTRHVQEMQKEVSDGKSGLIRL